MSLPFARWRDAGRRAARLLRHPFPAVPLLLYYWTSAPGIGSSDTALIVDEMRQLALSTHANHHNLTLIVGWLFSFLPVEDPARAANLASVFLGTVAVSLFYFLVLDRSRCRLTAAAAAACFMVSHSMWWHSTVAEVYAMNAVLTVAALVLLQRLERRHSDRTLGALFFLSGLALYNHVQMGILAVGAAAYLVGHLLVARQRGEAVAPVRLVVRCSALLLLGFLPYAATFIADVVRLGGLANVSSMALGGDFRSVMLRGSPWNALTDVVFLFVLQFPSPFLLAVAVGVVLLARRWRESPSLLALATVFLLNTAFFAFYNTWDKFAFLLPSFIILAFAGSFSVERLRLRLRAQRSRPAWGLATAALAASLVLPPVVYSQLADWADRGGPFGRYDNAASANVLNLAEYAANPNKRHYREFETYVRLLFERLPKDAVYVDDDGRAFYPVRYFQWYRGWRRDVQAELVNAWGFSGWGLDPEGFARLVGEAHRGNRPFFLVSIQEPFFGLITRIPGLDRLRYRRFPLDEKRWIYRLVTAAEEGRLPPEPPPRRRVVVGLDPRTAGSGTGEFSPRDPLVAALRFERNGEPFSFRFRWLPPAGGGAVESEALSLPFGCTSAWSTLELPGPRAAGQWTVEAVMDGAVVARTSFRVREGRP